MLDTNIKILLVDDDADVMDTLAEQFRMRGYEADVAYSGAAALESVRGDVPPHVVVLALSMPEMDGFTVLRNMRAVQENIQVIILAEPGFLMDMEAGEGMKANAMRMGALSFLEKPADADSLIEIMGTAFPQRIEDTLIAATFAEGGAFEEADDILAEADALLDVERRLQLETVI